MYLPSSPLSSAQRAWSNICAPRLVQRMCCFFSIPQSTSWSTVDSTRAVFPQGRSVSPNGSLFLKTVAMSFVTERLPLPEVDRLVQWHRAILTRTLAPVGERSGAQTVCGPDVWSRRPRGTDVEIVDRNEAAKLQQTTKDNYRLVPTNCSDRTYFQPIL